MQVIKSLFAFTFPCFPDSFYLYPHFLVDDRPMIKTYLQSLETFAKIGRKTRRVWQKMPWRRATDTTDSREQQSGHDMRDGSSLNIGGLLSDAIDTESPGGLLLAHQLGKKFVKRVSDQGLLAILVLISSELLQRGYRDKSPLMPPILRDVANVTIAELDEKLEKLSALEWQVDPFLQSEMDRLQTQPIELLDKYIVSDILPLVDSQVGPVLSSLVADPRQVKQLTASLKTLVKATAVLVLGPESQRREGLRGPDWFSRFGEATQTSVLEQLDKAGFVVEGLLFSSCA
jgi:hypothetical protein